MAVISEWVNKTQPRLTPQETEFLHKSLEKRDRQIQAQLEPERQLRELAESRQKEAEARAIAEIEKAIAAEDKDKAEAARAKEAEASDFNVDGTKLASGGYKDGSVKLWDLNSRTSKIIGRHQKPVFSFSTPKTCFM